MIKTIITILMLSAFAFGFNSEEIFIASDFSKKKACEVFDNKYLADTLNWNSSIIKKEETKFRRASVCTINHSEENMLVRLGWKSDRAVNNKVLEKQFANFLKKGEKGIKYKEISNQNGNQILFGKGQEKLGFITYIARKRFGNEKAIQVEIRSKTRDEESSRKLVLEMIEKVK